jgi:hypothetical protein
MIGIDLMRARSLLLAPSVALTVAALAGCVDGATPVCPPDGGCGYDFADSPYAASDTGGGKDAGPKDAPADSPGDSPGDVATGG